MRVATWVVLVAAVSAGCVDMGGVSPHATEVADADAAVLRPATDWYNVSGVPESTTYYGAHPDAQPFHSFEEVEAKIAAWNETFPHLVDVRVIGASWQGRPLWDVVLTDESIAAPKPVVLFDAGHHGNELAGIELSLYVIDFLLENAARNATVAAWLRDVEVHTVPIVNPDGYVVQSRGNALGVNLNRNYDLDWGNQLGASNSVMGTLAHATNRSMPSVAVVAENSGPHAFSEPESQAMKALVESLQDRLAAYMTYHTPTNALVAPWSAFEGPFPLPAEHDALFEHVLQWTRDNTEYRAGKAAWANFSAGLPYSASGSSQDWVYALAAAPSFTLEVEIWYTSVQSGRYAERVYVDPYQGLAYWMEASLPIPLYVLANWQAFDAWRLPDAPPPLPEGVPPAPVEDKTGLLLLDDHGDGDPGDMLDWVWQWQGLP